MILPLVIKHFLQTISEIRDDSSYKKYGNKTGWNATMEYHNCYPTSIAFLCDELYFSV